MDNPFPFFLLFTFFKSSPIAQTTFLFLFVLTVIVWQLLLKSKTGKKMNEGIWKKKTIFT